MNWRGQMSCTRVHTQTQSLRSHRKKAEEVSVGGSVAPTRDDKRQLSSRHCVTLCTCKGWMEIHGWGERERERLCPRAKISNDSSPRFYKDVQSTCEHMYAQNKHTNTHMRETVILFLMCSIIKMAKVGMLNKVI